jgi:prepilin-type N-terminal cleavage/methylation domain-containing protein
MRINNNRGFSLVEVIMASAVMLIGLLALTSYVNFLQRDSRFLEAKLDSLFLKDQIASILRSQKSCLVSLRKYTAYPAELATATDNTALKKVPEITIATLAEVANSTLLDQLKPTDILSTIEQRNKDNRINAKLNVDKMTITDLKFDDQISTSPIGTVDNLKIIQGTLSVHTSLPDRLLAPLKLPIYIAYDLTKTGLDNIIVSCGLRESDTINRQCGFEGTWFYRDASDSNDFAVTCMHGKISWCPNTDPSGNDSPVGYIGGKYYCIDGGNIKVETSGVPSSLNKMNFLKTGMGVDPNDTNLDIATATADPLIVKAVTTAITSGSNTVDLTSGSSGNTQITVDNTGVAQ